MRREKRDGEESGGVRMNMRQKVFAGRRPQALGRLQWLHARAQDAHNLPRRCAARVFCRAAPLRRPPRVIVTGALEVVARRGYTSPGAGVRGARR